MGICSHNRKNDHKMSSESSEPEVKTLKEAAATPGIGMRLTLSLVSKKFSSVSNISTEKLQQWLSEEQTTSDSVAKDNVKSNTDLVLLDCRPEEEYNVSHIDGALRVGYPAEAEQVVPMIPQLNNPGEKKVCIVCYCAIGYRASDTASKLQKYIAKQPDLQPRVTGVFNLEGSLFKWTNEGRPMVNKANKPTTQTHPYNSTFGRLLIPKHWKMN